jgi:hypothetical protein
MWFKQQLCRKLLHAAYLSQHDDFKMDDYEKLLESSDLSEGNEAYAFIHVMMSTLTKSEWKDKKLTNRLVGLIKSKMSACHRATFDSIKVWNRLNCWTYLLKHELK